MHSNYATNQFQSDPNEGFGRNAAPKKVGGHAGPVHVLMPKMAAATCLLRIIVQVLPFFQSTHDCLSTLSQRHAKTRQRARQQNYMMCLVQIAVERAVEHPAAEAESDDGKHILKKYGCSCCF